MRRNWLSLQAKRALDIAGSAIGLAAFSPVIGAATLAVRLTMGSPAFFRQTRPGQEGRPFELIKLRTMLHPVVGAEDDAQRVTPLGTFLRSTSIDELPTLWNVLKGDMSLVGPRALLMEYLDRYTPEQARRMEAKPGVTGWAQINGRNSLSWKEKFELDVWYVDHQSLVLDLRILLATIPYVLRRTGISHEGHATMPRFQGEESA